MDYYKSHLAKRVQETAWSRGYVVLYHYGNTTGIAQVNDTDLHMRLEQLYIELETSSFTEKQLLDPCDISRTRQEVIDDIAAVWRRIELG